MKVSFDFDGCLYIDVVGEYAKELVSRGVEVRVTTARVDNKRGNPNWNDDLFAWVTQCNIPITNVHFTNESHKWKYFKENEDFIWHLDDDWEAVSEINANTKVKAITNFGNNSWKEECEALLMGSE